MSEANEVPAPDLGARLNAARRKRRLSVAEVAEQCDLSRSTVRDLLSGRRTPTPDVAARLLRVLQPEPATAGELGRLSTSRWLSSSGSGEVRVEEPTVEP